MRGAKVVCRCKNCKQEFVARAADVKRGWAKFCSKSCKAKEQTRRTGCAGPRDYQEKPDGGLCYAPSHGQDLDATS